MRFHRSRWVTVACVALALAASGAARAQSQPEATPADPALELLRSTVRQASSYVETYVPALGTLIMREAYVQNARGAGAQAQHRELTAEFVLVFLPGSRAWLGFRDVIDVDGKPQGDRQKRLRRLFAAGRPVSAERLSDESARFNIGGLERTVNVPTLALFFLDPRVLGGLSFGLKGETTLDGVRAYEVTFREEARPTVVRVPGSGEDVPAQGSFWIEADTGRVLKTRLWLTVERSTPRFPYAPRFSSATAEVTVAYQPHAGLGLLVPTSMRELYVGGGVPPLEIECQATYSGFQRTTAETDETYQLPQWGRPGR